MLFTATIGREDGVAVWQGTYDSNSFQGRILLEVVIGTDTPDDQLVRVYALGMPMVMIVDKEMTLTIKRHEDAP